MSGFTTKRVRNGRRGTKTNQPGLNMQGNPASIGRPNYLKRAINRRVHTTWGLCGFGNLGFRCRYEVDPKTAGPEALKKYCIYEKTATRNQMCLHEAHPNEAMAGGVGRKNVPRLGCKGTCDAKIVGDYIPPNHPLRGPNTPPSLFGLNLLDQQTYAKIDLWIEWPAIPYANTNDYKTWIENIISFMKAFSTETIVLRFGYNPLPPPSNNNWPASPTDDFHDYYNNWITRYKSYEMNSNQYSIKRILDETSVKTVYFLVQPATGDISGYKDGIKYLNYLLKPGGKWDHFRTKTIKTGICIEVEAFIYNTDTTYTDDPAANTISKKISYLLKNYSPGTLFTATNIKTVLGACNLTLDNDSVLAATGSPTQGKSINRIVDSSTNLIIKRYFGQCYNMTSSPPSSLSNTNTNTNKPVIQYLYNNVKLVDTDKSNYWAILSLETDKLRKLNGAGTSWQTPTNIPAQLGLLYQNNWSSFNKLANEIKSTNTLATFIGSTGPTNINGFSGYYSENNLAPDGDSPSYTTYCPVGLCPNPVPLGFTGATATYSNIPLQNIMVFQSDFIEQISNPSTGLTGPISTVHSPLF